EHEEERERIAAAGRAAVLHAHTYGHRMATLLTAVTSGAGRTSLGVSPHDRPPPEDGMPGNDPGRPGAALAPAPFPATPLGASPFLLDALQLPGEHPRVLLVGRDALELGRELQTRQPAEVVVRESVT